MTVVTELDLPEIDYMSPGFGPDTYHQLLAEVRAKSWIAHSPLAYIVLDRESGDFFLRSRATAFPGRQIGEIFGITVPRDGKILTFSAGAHFCLGVNLARAELEEALKFLAPRMPGLALDGEPKLGGIEGIYGVDALPLRWGVN